MINQNLLLTGDDGYNLTNSLRFRQSVSAYLNRTQTTPTTATKWTYSYWVKRGIIGGSSVQTMISGTGGAGSGILFWNDKLWASSYSAGYQWNFLSAAVYRDPSAWYHIMVAYDSTQATDTNRVKIYVNGVQLTAFTTDVGATTYPSLNSVGFVGGVSGSVRIGLRDDGFYYLDGYLAEMYFVDGQQLTPSSFGETSSTTGVWIPKKYTGTYGTNGFYLPFTDNSALTTSSNVGLGKDFSGNANYWTTNNISITSGSTYDSMTDVPTLTSATTANYCVLNPLQTTQSASVPTNANLTSPANAGAWRRIGGSMQLPTTGKFYFEYTCDSFSTFATFSIGVFSGNIDTGNNVIGTSATEWGYNGQSGYATNNNTNISSGFTTTTTGDVLQLAYDASTGSLWFGKNNTWQGASSPNPSTGTSPTYTGVYNITPVMVQNWATQSANFGQRPFAYTPPTGFNRLNTFNLPTPTIGATASTQAGKYMNTVLYTGTGSTPNAVTGVGFQPDFLWIKSRSNAYSHLLANAITGASKTLQTDSTAAEQTYGCINSFDSNGFTVDTDGTIGANNSGSTFVAWNWKANGAGSTNTAGSITSTVSANTSAGFSIVTWTGTGSTATIGHGLGVAPKMFIWFHRTNAGAYSHITYHASLPSAAYVVYLNLTIAQSSDNNAFNSTAPTSSVFTVGGYNSSDTMVAYCFAEVAGYSAFGSYTGNGSSDGTFVYTGFRPRYILSKRTDIAGLDWNICDTARGTYNVVAPELFANVSQAESSNSYYDFLSNGFKARSVSSSVNASSGTYIYMAFAENPFKYANAR